MSGTKAARRIQFVKETVQGTEIQVATGLWRGTGLLKDLREMVYPAEDVGYAAPLNRRYTPKLYGGLTIDATPATFEQLPYLLEMCIKKIATGVADGGGGSGKIYAYPFPTTAPNTNTLGTYSVQAGDEQEMEFATFLFAPTVKLSGKAKEAVMMSADLNCRTWAPNTLTGTGIAFVVSGNHITDSANLVGVRFKVGDKILVSGATTAANNGVKTVASVVGDGDITVSETLSADSATPAVTLQEVFSVVALPTVEEILFGNGKLYMNSVAESIGATQQLLTFLAFDMEIKGGWWAVWSGDGNLYFSRVKHTREMMGITTKVTFEHDAYAVAEKAFARAGTPRQMRMQFNGSTLATAGTAYSTKALRIDQAGTWMDLPSLEDDSGNDTITLTFRAGYDSTAALYANIAICNALTALT